MAENKTKATEVKVDDFIDAIENPVRQADAKAVRAMLERVTGDPARMWGPSIIGFGSYHYKYESGHEGTMCRLGFSPRKGELVLYLTGTVSKQHEALTRLGKHKTGKGCLYIKKLADVDMGVLEELAVASRDYMDATYPD
ncbi:DUF1801 domain-containing protein [Sphingomonas sp. LB-2]|uniref:DUF1801 domain-containing protein n=1 Tax=Sphingomonas caeni TaxID=2984949 RepID=UPI002231D056|nr:DUF1801 domain-containing protein [Sphingomonas caeni]MCW3847149.1 DUF1801 domain-containing protein [Sphingomonas caeni]